MTDEHFTYEDFENARDELVKRVNKLLNEKDKRFLLSFKKLAPDWSLYDLKDFPSVKWKIENLELFKKGKPKGYEEAVGRLEKFFGQSQE